MGRIVRVGLTGGIGSGKSAVADVWRERGAAIVDADVLAREAVAPGSPGLSEIASRWPAVIAAGGVEVDAADPAGEGRRTRCGNGRGGGHGPA